MLPVELVIHPHTYAARWNGSQTDGRTLIRSRSRGVCFSFFLGLTFHLVDPLPNVCTLLGTMMKAECRVDGELIIAIPIAMVFLVKTPEKVFGPSTNVRQCQQFSQVDWPSLLNYLHSSRCTRVPGNKRQFLRHRLRISDLGHVAILVIFALTAPWCCSWRRRSFAISCLFHTILGYPRHATRRTTQRSHPST